ncbi:MAG TPA: hypothetical protein PK765_04025 [bacterium]|nr:hypothetical protein [bacterium]
MNLSLPSASIPANGYYLITKTAVTSGGNLLKDNDVTAAHTDMTLALSSSNPDLILKNASDVEVDRATVAFDPLIGNADSPASMERRPYPGDGTDSSDWYTGQARTLFDTGTPQGTPGAENVYDVVLPSITTSLSDGTLFAHGTLVLRYAYTDTG